MVYTKSIEILMILQKIGKYDLAKVAKEAEEQND